VRTVAHGRTTFSPSFRERSSKLAVVSSDPAAFAYWPITLCLTASVDTPKGLQHDARRLREFQSFLVVQARERRPHAGIGDMREIGEERRPGVFHPLHLPRRHALVNVTVGCSHRRRSAFSDALSPPLAVRGRTARTRRP
jgi:hypothetical protein